MLFLIVGIIYERRHTREIAEYGGLAHVMPRYAIVFAFAMLSSAGLPLSTDLWRVYHHAGRLRGEPCVGGVRGDRSDPRRGVPVMALSATMLGQITNGKNLHLPDLSFREMVVFAPLIAWSIWIGIYPKPTSTWLEKPVAQIVDSG